MVDPAKPLIDNWHIDALAEHLQAVVEDKINFLMINIGPGYAKSLIASVMFSVWMWVRNPRIKIIAATYANDLTVRDSLRVRGLLESTWFLDTFQPSWTMDKRNEQWLSNSATGERRAMSVGGAATGFRSDIQIFDDLLNASAQHSEAARVSAKEWAVGTMSTRFNDQRHAKRVVIGQRLHEEDPYGAMLATGDYEHLCLPSEYEPERRSSTSIGWSDPRTEPGQLLFPELFTADVLASAKRTLGAYGYAGQHQQRPAPLDGGLFRRSWWQYYQQAPSFEQIVLSIDATFKDSKDSDYVAIHAYGFIGPRAYLLDRTHDKMGYGATKQAVKALYAKWKPSAVLIEDKANGPAIIEELSKEMYGVIAVNPQGGKTARAWAVSPDVEAGNVFLPAEPWSEEVVLEAAQFPNGAHDDDVDAMTQALNWRRGNTRRYGLFEFYANTESEIMAARRQRKNNQEIMAGVRSGDEDLVDPVETIEVPNEEILKVDVPANVARCTACGGFHFQRIPGGKRCSNCGQQVMTTALMQNPDPGQMRK